MNDYSLRDKRKQKLLYKVAICILISILSIGLSSCKNTKKFKNLTGNRNFALKSDGSVSINRKVLEKTSQVVVIPEGTTVVIKNSEPVIGGTSINSEGVFPSDRVVQLSPYSIGKYEVTQELCEAVMGINLCYFDTSKMGGSYSRENPKGENVPLCALEEITWYEAITFCNKLSILLGLEPCYSVEGVDFATLKYEEIPLYADSKWDAAKFDITKKGYRLPTEAEWEFAARGGDQNSEVWNYTYSGISTSGDETSEYIDSNLAQIAWYSDNANRKAHEVGIEKVPGVNSANSLGIYDMSGNVWEWCWDWYDFNSVTKNDDLYTVDGIVVNPLGVENGKCRVMRGGSWLSLASFCEVTFRSRYLPDYQYFDLGIRLARSL